MSLRIGGDRRINGGMDRQEAMDALYECLLHGRLAGDATPPCGCFPHAEGFGVIDGEGPTTAGISTLKAA